MQQSKWSLLYNKILNRLEAADMYHRLLWVLWFTVQAGAYTDIDAKFVTDFVRQKVHWLWCNNCNNVMHINGQWTCIDLFHFDHHRIEPKLFQNSVTLKKATLRLEKRSLEKHNHTILVWHCSEISLWICYNHILINNTCIAWLCWLFLEEEFVQVQDHFRFLFFCQNSRSSILTSSITLDTFWLLSSQKKSVGWFPNTFFGHLTV